MKISDRMRKTLGFGLLVATLGMGGVEANVSPPLTCVQEQEDDAPDVTEERAAAKQDLLKELKLLAEWCTKKKLFACRDEVFELVLQFEPDSSVAMRGMGYKKQRDGTWEADKRRKAPRNYNKDAEKEFPAKRTALTQAYKDRMLALLDSFGEELALRDRLAIIEDVLFADPDEPRVHAMRGEVKLDDRWVLSQTAVAKKHRVELKDMVRKAFGTLPKAVESEANAKEAAFGIAWKGIYVSPIVRSLSTGSKLEAERLTQAMWATRSYFNDALSGKGNLPEDLTVYTFGSEEDRMTFLNNHPDIDEAYRETLMFYDGSGIAGTGDFAHWAPEPTRRLDGQVRHAITWLFADSFKIFPRHGWIFEGFGLYMTRELVGTRLTWYVRPQAEGGTSAGTSDEMFRKNLLDTRTNWMSEANKMLQKESRPKLQFLVGKDVNQLSMDDMLYSYVLAAYLIEAEGDKLPVLLKKIGNGASSIVAIESVFGVDLLTFDARVRRWLQERN